MRSERLRELIHLELDGEATQEERIELGQQLDREPESRSIRDSIETLHRTLDKRPQVNPPENFREQIADAVKRERRTSQPQIARFFASRTGRRSQFIRFGLAAAAVVALAFLVAPAMMNVDTDQLGGTMAPPTELRSQPTSVPIGGGITGTILTEIDVREVIVRIELESRGPARLELNYDPTRLQLVSMSGAGSDSDHPTGQLIAELTGPSPSALRFVRLSEAASSLTLNISMGGAESGPLELNVPSSTNFSKPEL
ncbi:MAG: hypothetical protein KY432_03215 [Acidobacteria bacterium]|nr:hypothetical protein [Acidobacteriota bacterium]